MQVMMDQQKNFMKHFGMTKPYVKNRHIGESRRLISDVIEIAKLKTLEGFLVTMD